MVVPTASSAQMAGAAQADLLDRLGRDRVALGEAARKIAGFDPQGREGPVAVARPAHAEHVELVLRVGRMRHVPVEVRARLPSAWPDELRDVLVLDASGLNRPPAVDIGRRTVTVGAGVDVAAVDRAARQARLCLRGVPSTLSGDSVGALFAGGEPGELGLGDGALCEDVVSALCVTGGGRTVRVGAADLAGIGAWLGVGAPTPLGLLCGGEGKAAVLCELTLRLRRAPLAAWAHLQTEANRELLLAAFSAARAVLSSRLCDSVLIEENKGKLRLDIRATTWRGDDDDLKAVCKRVADEFKRHELKLSPFESEDKRVRLGQSQGKWPKPQQLHQPTLDLRVAWPDVPSVLDVADAVCAELAEPPERSWSIGADWLRLRVHLGLPKPEQHPLINRLPALMEAGALPIGGGPRVRQAVRERMPPAAKVLLAALGRGWDPETSLGRDGGNRA